MLAKVFLVLIVILGSVLRLFNLSHSPPSLNWDEAALGYNAYSVLLTGKDEYGAEQPLFTRSFDEYKSMLPVYIMSLSVRFLGVNERAVRVPTAIWGTLTLIALYFLLREIMKDKRVPLLATLFLAIEPWSVHLSRVYHEAIMAMFFYLAMLLFFVLSRKKQWLMPIGLMCGFISMFSYNTNKVLVPLTLVLLYFLFSKSLFRFNKWIKISSIVILFLGMGLFLQQIIFGHALARVESTTILRILPESDKQGIAKIADFFYQWFGRYISYFSPSNLFLREPGEPATVIPGNSMFFPYEFIFWIIGMFILIRNHIKFKNIIFLMLIAPIPASMTWNWFQPGRTLSLFIIYSVLIAIGFSFLLDHLSKSLKIILTISTGILIVMSIFYLFDSINYQIPAKTYGSWQPGFRESMPVVATKMAGYDSVIIDTPHAQPYIFVLFYTQYNPAKYLSELDLRKIGTPRKVYDFGKFTFKNVNFELEEKKSNVLYVLWKGSKAFGQFSSDELASKDEIPNIDGDTIVQIVAFK